MKGLTEACSGGSVLNYERTGNCEEYFLPDSGSRPEKKSVNFFVHEESAAGRIFSAHATEVLYGNAPKRRATIFLKGGEPCLCGNCACSY